MPRSAQRVESLYETFGPPIYRRCLRLLRDPADAEDATQEVFVRAYRHLDAWSYGDSPLPWLYGIATRFCLNQLRDRSRRSRLAPFAVDAVPEADPCDVTANRQMAALALDGCDERTKLVATYALMRGMTQDEVAGELNISRRTVVNRLQRFFRAARRRISWESP
jgi:RNA polymerase sigma-70 factor (ECF subfamily)